MEPERCHESQCKVCLDAAAAVAAAAGCCEEDYTNDAAVVEH